MNGQPKALRSFLFAPGNHARRVEKALTLDADAVILDLEDAVATAEKPATREAVAAAFARPRRGLLYVRVNAVDTEFCYGDLRRDRAARARRHHPAQGRKRRRARHDRLAAGAARTRARPGRGRHRPDPDHRDGARASTGSARSSAPARGSSASRSAPAISRSTSTWSGAAARAELAHARAAIVTASRAAGIEAPLDTVWVDSARRRGARSLGAHRARPRLPGQDVHPPGPDRRSSTASSRRATRRSPSPSASSPPSPRRKPRAAPRSSSTASSSITRSSTARSACWTRIAAIRARSMPE